MAESFPLSWPDRYPRTTDRRRAPFKTSFDRAVRGLFSELKLLGAPDWNVILSTNIPVRRDGRPYAQMSNPKDPGVAVYFRFNTGGKQMVLACDKWQRVEDNIRALELTVEAMRGMDRWGCSDMLERVFQGFTALPAPEGEKAWWEVLGVAPGSDPAFIEDTYRRKMRTAHPDAGGSTQEAQALNRAIEQARLAGRMS